MADDPVISVDCKKKELIGNFKNEGWVSVGISHDALVLRYQALKIRGIK